MSGGGSTTTQVINRDPPSAEQTALTRKQIELAEFQLEQLQKQVTLQEEAFEALEPLVEGQLEDAAAARERAEKLRPIEDEILERQLEALRLGGAATDEQKRLIADATESSLAAGESDIDQFSEEAVRRLTQEFAPARGLRPGDSPIVDRGQLVAREAVRQQGQLARDLRTAQANAELNFPLAAGQLGLAQSNFTAGLTQAAQNLQANLQQAAVANRLNLANSVTGAGLGLANAGRTNLAGTISALNASRGSTLTNSTSRSLGFGDLLVGAGKIAGGVGGLFTGVSRII
jgi:hypothetical protein